MGAFSAGMKGRGALAFPLLLLLLVAGVQLAFASDSASQEPGFHIASANGNGLPFFSVPHDADADTDSLASVTGRILAEAPNVIDGPPVDNSSFVLAAQRTQRQDPLDGYKKYTGGWNISEKHYWASVGFTAAPLFVIAAAWFVGFGLVLTLICCCYCCFPRRSYSYSRTAYALSLIVLIIFTIAAMIGAFFLYYGQGKFHNSTTVTLNYVVDQANFTVENLRNFSDTLAAAKRVRVKQFFLPSDAQNRIDTLELKLNTSTNDLSTKTNDNSERIKETLDKVRLTLVVIAAAMMLLAFVGFLCSILGMQGFVSVLVIIGWILITGTFILSGVFLLLHNVVSDTCVAMDEWIQQPHSRTALDDILPCVDISTVNDSLIQSKQTTYQIASGINQVISGVANVNFPPGTPLAYYNQSGPLAPPLCNPYNSDLSNRQCASGETSLSNAAEAWRSYVCQATGSPGSEVCTSVGRFTPDIFDQLTAAATVSFGLYHYGPFFAQLADCTFVRDTFARITKENCPDLDRYSMWVYVGLALASAAVMLSLILWVVYARERRHRAYNKGSPYK